MSSYFGCCGMCKHMNLYDKYDRFGKKFKCTLNGHYWNCDEKACNRFEGDPRRSNDDVEKARMNKL